jgi:hypothetical protein
MAPALTCNTLHYARIKYYSIRCIVLSSKSVILFLNINYLLVWSVKSKYVLSEVVTEILNIVRLILSLKINTNISNTMCVLIRRSFVDSIIKNNHLKIYKLTTNCLIFGSEMWSIKRIDKIDRIYSSEILHTRCAIWLMETYGK